jgi:hypothetical protein
VKRRFPNVREPKKQDICYATQNRQDAVKVLSPAVDVVIVVGSPTSSNSNRLRELAQRLGRPAYMVDEADALQPAWFEGATRVGLTAGASAPDILVQQVIARLRELGAVSLRKLDGVVETVHFPLPKGLKSSQERSAFAAQRPDGVIARRERRQSPLPFSTGATCRFEGERKRIQSRTEELQSKRNQLSKPSASSRKGRDDRRDDRGGPIGDE